MIEPFYLDLPIFLLGSHAGGSYREFRPSPDLRDYVACLWVKVIRGGESLASTPIIPDGCGDIMVYDDHVPRVAGPDAVTRWTALYDGLVITGIRLRPGAFRSVLKCPADILVNETAVLGDLVRGSASLHREVIATDNIKGRLLVLEAWVRKALSESAYDDRAVLNACRVLTANPRKDIDSLAFEHGWSSRTIHRRFLAVCGYGPKHFQRIMRVQNALRLMHTDTTLVEAAVDTGFADQAHMTRDFRAITGFTPGSYLELTSPEFGTWMADD